MHGWHDSICSGVAQRTLEAKKYFSRPLLAKASQAAWTNLSPYRVKALRIT